MTPSRPTRSMNIIPWMAPVAVVVVAFFFSLRWLSRFDDAVVLGVSAVVAIAVMAWSLAVSIRYDRRLDEVQRASSRFSWTWGAMAGSVCTVLLLMLPPFQSLIVDLPTAIVAFRGGSEEVMERKALLLAFTFGFMSLLLLQIVGTVAAAAWWWARQR